MINSSIASWNPSDVTIFTTPYVVFKSYERATSFGKDVDTYDSSFKGVIEDLNALLDTVINKERKKEINFINAFCAILEKDNPQIAEQIRGLFYENQTSNVINAIQRYRAQVLDLSLNFPQAIQEFNKNWEEYNNRHFMTVLNDRNAIKVGPENSINDFLEQFLQALKDDYHGNEMSKERYDILANGVVKQMYEMGCKRFGDDMSSSFESLAKHPYFVEKITKHSEYTNNGEINFQEIIIKFVEGFLNGVSSERFAIDLMGDLDTSRILRRYGSLTGTKSGMGQMQTDMLGLYSANIDFRLSDLEDIDTVQKLNQKIQELAKVLKDKEKAFVIHTSSKDLSLNKNYNTSRGLDAHITKDGSLDVRLSVLKEMQEALRSGTSHDAIQNLIFAIVNAGKDAVASDKKSSIIEAITSICAAYMFEDYIDTIVNFDSDTNIEHIHIYLLNGKYYTVSDILTLTKRKINAQGRTSKEKFVKVQFKPTTINEWEVMNKGDFKGKARWDEVLASTLRNGKLNFSLDIRSLLNAIYPEGF